MRSLGIFLLLCIGVVGFRFAEPQLYRFPALKFFPPMKPSALNPTTVEGVDLGRHLFYDPILSRDSTVSCAGCHRQASAFADGGVRFSNGINGSAMSRNTTPLFNLAWADRFFWDGRSGSLEDQAFHPVRAHDEMNLDWPTAVRRLRNSKLYKAKFRAAFPGASIDSSAVAKALSQFERTLVSYRSRYDSVINGLAYFTQDERDGMVLLNDMTKGDCLHCHTTDADALGTTNAFSNNGLDPVYDALLFTDKGLGGATGLVADNGKFKIPSLRNVALTAPYMHDGRFNTLEEVIDFYSDGVHRSANVDPRMGTVATGGAKLTDDEKKQIVAFLHTLTDYAFVHDPAHANPFLIKSATGPSTP